MYTCIHVYICIYVYLYMLRTITIHERGLPFSTKPVKGTTQVLLSVTPSSHATGLKENHSQSKDISLTDV